MTSFVDKNGSWNFRELSIAFPTLEVSKVQKGMELGSNFGRSKPLRDSSSSCGQPFLTVYPQMYKRENVLIVMIGVLFAWRVGNNPSYSKRLLQFSEHLEATGSQLEMKTSL
ncbi:hypothetical protein Patl1_13457 [Pistacia atlantica]|uniref:Uncharacterized protein n=1 Tax=Pistacia atlantica TaxID=434234 RepID=A0ACC1AS28_9ROSI|nr:hypothetical protein Patl1_13457 [Pistacia atlantica]